MGDNLLDLPEAIPLARRTVANMRQNIAIALINGYGSSPSLSHSVSCRLRALVPGLPRQQQPADARLRVKPCATMPPSTADS
jgi:hypothetical protein